MKDRDKGSIWTMAGNFSKLMKAIQLQIQGVLKQDLKKNKQTT